MDSDVERCSQKFLELSRVNCTLDQAGLASAAVAWAALRQQMLHDANVLLLSAREQPVLWCYQSDATSFKCRAQITDRSSSGVQQRRGRHLEEFLSERGMLKTFSIGGRPMLAMLLGMPRPLRAGKAADNHFVAACEFEGHLHLENHASILITHLCFDRAILSAVHRRFVQLHAMRSDVVGENSWDARVRDNSLWLIAVGCCAHDMQNGIKWGLSRAVEPGLIDDLHICIESLLNSIAPLYSHLKPWLVRVVSFTGTQSEDLAFRWWRFLGADPRWLDLLSVVRPYFRGGSLHVNPLICNDVDHMDKIMKCWVYCMRWKHFAESRWCGIGMACRQLLRSVAMGVEYLVAETRADTSVSDYFLHGAARLTPSVKRYVAAAAAATRPAEAFLLEIMEDDRLGRRSGEAHAALKDELQYLEAVHDDVWECVATAIDEPMHHVVKHLALHAAHTSHAYLAHKVFDQLSRQPWSLVHMQPSLALDRVRDMADKDIEHRVVRQIKTLLELGRPRKLLEDAICLLRETPWTTKQAEQSHASITAVHRHHPEASAEHVALRAALHACRHLFHEADDARREKTLRDKVARIKRKRGHAVLGRNVFYAEYVQETKRARPTLGPLPTGAQQQLLTKANRLYGLLPAARKRHYDKLAVEWSREHDRQVESDLAHAEACLRLLRNRLASQQEQSGVPNDLGECRFDRRAMEQLVDRLAAVDVGSHTADAVRQQAGASPAALSIEQRSALDDYTPIVHSEAPQAQWANLACQHRDTFRDCVFMSARPECRGAWVLMYATQSPRLAKFLCVRPLDYVCRQSHRVHLDASNPVFAHEYRYGVDHADLVSAHAIPSMEDGSDLLVTSSASMVGHFRVVSDAEAVPFIDLVNRMGLAQGKKDAPASAAKAGPDARALLERYPWIREVLRSDKACDPSRHRSEVAVPHEPADEGLPRPADEDVDAAWDALRGIDDVLEAPRLSDSEDFYCTVRATDGRERVRLLESRHVAVRARGGEPKAWCARFSISPIHSFSVAKYGEDDAWHLALETARRLQVFYDGYCSSGADDFRYNPDAMTSVPECQEFMMWVAGLEVGSASWQRAVVIDQLGPTNPP